MSDTMTELKPTTESVAHASTIKASQINNAATSQGFNNVNKEWIKKTMTFDQGLELLTKGKAETEDLNLPMESVKFENDKGLIINLDGNKVKPNDHSLRQLGARLDIPAKILLNWYNTGDSEDVNTVLRILENGKRKYLKNETAKQEGEEEDVKQNFLWRTRKDGTLRATLSNKFARFDNRWMLEAYSKIVPDGRLSHWKGDSDTVYSNVLIPDNMRKEGGEDYSGGFAIGNSEIGCRALSCHPYIFSWICFNGNVWGEIKGVSYTRKHLGVKIDYDAQFKKLVECIDKQIPLIPQHITMLMNTKSLKWSDSSKKLMAQAAIDLKLTKKQGTELLLAYEFVPELSCFGLINAITRASQKMSPNLWVEMDMYSTRLMDSKNWSTYEAKAKALTSKDVESCYATVS